MDSFVTEVVKMVKIRNCRKLLVIVFLGLWVLLPGVVRASETPSAVVESFYEWFFSRDNVYREKISEQSEIFEPELMNNLIQGFSKKPGDKNGWVDFNPFLNAQWDGDSASVRREIIHGNTASVIVDIKLTRGNSSVKVFLRKTGDNWKIANFIYEDFNLLSFLKTINR
jgi:hypothetical protein